MSFLLSNPSNNIFEHIAQINKLAIITNGNYTTSSTEGPFITVNEDYITKKNKLPGIFKGKVNIIPSSTSKIDQNILKSLNILIPIPIPDDTLAPAYISKYNITNSFICIWDTNNKTNTPTQILNAILSVKNPDKLQLVIFQIGESRTRLPDLTQFNVPVHLIKGLDTHLILKLATSCPNHLISGSISSIIAAKITQNTKLVMYANPIVNGSIPEDNWIGINAPSESSLYFERLYYINLEKRTDRKDHMDRQLSKFGLLPARVIAVDGKAIPWNQEFGITSQYWNNGALGYCFSYQNALIDAIKHGYEQILIMDDDAVLSDNFFDVLAKAFKALPDDWHLLYLAANHGKDNIPTEKISDSLYKLKGSVGSHAIIINSKAFKNILNFASTPYGPLDIFLSIYQQIFPCYITYPGLAYQLSGHSDIINKDIDYVKDWGIDYINWLPNPN